MGGVYSFCPKSRTAKLDLQESAILDCKLTRDKIKAYIKRLEKNEKLGKDKAKSAMMNKDRDRARIYLQQSKLYSAQIQSANGQLNMLDEQIINIESAQHRKEAFLILENGNKVLKKLNEEVNIEKWEKIADDMSEMQSKQDEIGEFFKNHGISQSEYEEAVDKELENLIRLESSSDNLYLPSASTKEPLLKEAEMNKAISLVES